MKHALFILFTIVTIDSTTIINMPSGVWLAVVPQQCEVEASTPTVKVPTVSTGPVIMKSAFSADCYSVPYVNPNGSCGAPKWVPCPQ